MKDIFRQKGAGKMWLGYCKVISLQKMAGIYQEDYLTSTDQATPD